MSIFIISLALLSASVLAIPERSPRVAGTKPNSQPTAMTCSPGQTGFCMIISESKCTLACNWTCDSKCPQGFRAVVMGCDTVCLKAAERRGDKYECGQKFDHFFCAEAAGKEVMPVVTNCACPRDMNKKPTTTTPTSSTTPTTTRATTARSTTRATTTRTPTRATTTRTATRAATTRTTSSRSTRTTTTTTTTTTRTTVTTVTPTPTPHTVTTTVQVAASEPTTPVSNGRKKSHYSCYLGYLENCAEESGDDEDEDDEEAGEEENNALANGTNISMMVAGVVLSVLVHNLV